MTSDARWQRGSRMLGAVLVGLWAGLAVAVAAAYRPGGPVDFIVVGACFLPALVASAAIGWPPAAAAHRDRLILAWLGLCAVLFAIPLLASVVRTLAEGGPQRLVPSAEVAYAAFVALLLTTTYSAVGVVHGWRGVIAFERAATLRAGLLGAGLAIGIAAAFGGVIFINDAVLQHHEPVTSRFGPTDPALVPPECHDGPRLGANATVSISARASVDGETRGEARLDGRRSGHDEAWSGTWSGRSGEGGVAYRRVGQTAWLSSGGSDVDAPGSSWHEVAPGLFGLAGADAITLDGPVRSYVSGPRGTIVAEDLGLEVVEGARARHCRTFVDGPTALTIFLPLRWLLSGDPVSPKTGLDAWRGEMDWWVFGDGELGRATIDVSGSRFDAWEGAGLRGSLEAELESVDRSRATDVIASRP